MRNLSFKNEIGANPICHIANVPSIYILVNYCPGLMQRISLCCLFMVVFNLRAQQNTELQKLSPKRLVLIDKVEILAGPNINFPNGKDRVSGNNPNVSTGYFAKTGYSAGISLIHSIGNFELKARATWDQRGYTEKLWDNEPNALYEWENNRKINYVTFSFIPAFFFGRNKNFSVFIGGSYNRLQKASSIQISYINGQIQQWYSNAAVLSIHDYNVDAILGLSYSVHLNSKSEVSIQLQDNYDLTDTVNENGQVIKNNTLNLIVAYKIIRKPQTKIHEN